MADINIDPLSPGMENRRSKVIFRDILDDPEIATSTVYAFNNDHADTKAWAARNNSALEDVTSDYATAVVDLKGLPSELFSSAMDSGFSPAPVTSISFSKDEAAAPVLITAFSGPEFAIEITSNVVSTKSSLTFSTEVSSTGSKADEAEYAFPGFYALVKAGFDGDVPATYREFSRPFL